MKLAFVLLLLLVVALSMPAYGRVIKKRYVSDPAPAHDVVIAGSGLLAALVAGILAFSLAACAGAAHAPPPPTPPVNLAIVFAHRLDGDAICAPFYTDVGEQHTHSTLCRLPATKDVVYCAIAADKGPGCQSLIPRAKPEAKAQPETPPAPAPLPPLPPAAARRPPTPAAVK